jgi:phage antirepressor YoqD-like protein
MRRLTVINGGYDVVDSQALMESRSIRNKMVSRTDVLDKVKKLNMLPDDTHVTVEMAANYYEVDRNTLKKIVDRHKDELVSDGMKLLNNWEIRNLLKIGGRGHAVPDIIKLPKAYFLSRRAVLRIGMLLRDSEVAKAVRSYLLNVEEIARDTAPLVTEQAVMELAKRLEELAPKGEAFDHYLGGEKSMSMEEVAKALDFEGVGRNNLFKILRQEGILQNGYGDRWNLPYQTYVNKGYFDLVWHTVDVWDRGLGEYRTENRVRVRVYPKGVEFIRRRLLKLGYQPRHINVEGVAVCQ